MTAALLFLILLALFFDFLNGFHDAANSIATIVSTRVLAPKYAVFWAAFFNFMAFLVFKHKVAATMGNMVDPSVVDMHVIFATLVGACAWNLITWYYGLPTSSSHALMGGLVGAAFVKAGSGVMVMSSINKTLIFMVISPVLGMILGMLIGVIMMWIFRRSSPLHVDSLFRKLQFFSAAAFSLGHGGNDAQKTMGIIALLLYSQGLLGGKAFHVPGWVALSCYAAMAIGTLFGGWRIVKTMGQKVSKLRPVDGCCVETGAAITLYTASAFGVPVSTTHTITGAIMGVGSLRRLTAVRWSVAGEIVWAWLFTIPAAAIISAFAYFASVAAFGG
jgi:PiT family inorganic phosphate transporter